MKNKHLAIIGYGILGRLLALRASTRGAKVTVFEATPEKKLGATSVVAGGMLAPLSELESCEALIHKLGAEGLLLWQAFREEYDWKDSTIQCNGSLIVAHPQDNYLLRNFEDRLSKASPSSLERWHICHPQEVENGISSTFQRGIHIFDEMHLDPQKIMHQLHEKNEQYGVHVQWQHPIDSIFEYCKDQSHSFDWMIDCRGLGARSSNYLPTLRGVRGEAILVSAPDVDIKRPIRVLHPRYALYVVPRDDNQYYLGATQLESESTHGITVRSSLELLSAAFSLHSGFSEAVIKKTMFGLRPAFSNNLPRIHYWENFRLLSLNGLYRHGYLLAPCLCERALDLIEEKITNPVLSELMTMEKMND